MFLIVDTNVLFSFFHSKSKVKELFKSLSEKGVSLIVPQYMFDELLGIMSEILRGCDLREDNFSVSLALLLKLLEIIPKGEYEVYRGSKENITTFKRCSTLRPFIGI
jgi:predicted nucleic acid-binding protein